MDAQKFSFRIYAAQSVSPPLRILFTLSVRAQAQSYAATLPHFAIVYRKGREAASTPSPFANAGTIRGTHGATLPASLARSPLQAEWHRPNMCVRIQFPLTFSFVSVGADGLLSLAGYELFLWGQYLCMEMCMAREKERGGTMGRNCLAKRRGSGANKWRVTIFGAHSLEQKMGEKDS